MLEMLSLEAEEASSGDAGTELGAVLGLEAASSLAAMISWVTMEGLKTSSSDDMLCGFVMVSCVVCR